MLGHIRNFSCKMYMTNSTKVGGTFSYTHAMFKKIILLSDAIYAHAGE